MNFTVRSVRRLFETERLEFRATLSRAGAPDFDDDAYWSAARENLLFYHPGHPGGRLLFGLHEAFLAPMLAAIGEAQDVLRQATHAGCGLPLMSLHPIEPAWGDAVGCRWHIEPAYAGWALLRPGEGSLDIEAVAAARQDMADRFGSHLAAFFGMEAASLFAKQGDLAAAARLNVDAALTLTGQVKPLARALASATRAAAWVDVEDLLQANADYFHPPSALEPVILRWLKRDGELAEVREIIARVAGPLSHAGWLNTRAGSAP